MVRQSPPCKCGPEHWRMLHPRTGAQCEGGAYEEARPEGGTVLVRPCDCTRYRPAKGVNVVSKRSTLKYAKAAENKAPDKLGRFWGARRFAGPGEPDWVMYGRDGDDLLAGETKHRKITEARKEALREAHAHAKGRRGAPLAPLYEVDKPGPGSREGVLEIISFTIDDLVEYTERIRCHHE